MDPHLLERPLDRRHPRAETEEADPDTGHDEEALDDPEKLDLDELEDDDGWGEDEEEE